ncbi:MAG: hypothetical protein SVZ03_06425 [Spirochaetota bacterium]|nr:hypothetical protein [Spirochaetota bacterium]
MVSEDNQKKYVEEGNRLILKGRFKSNSLNFYGLFLIIFDKRGDMDSYHILVSTYSSTYEIEPHSSWEKYEESILKLRWNNECNPSMTSYLQDIIKEIANDENQKSNLYDYIRNYEYDNIDITITDIINRIIHDKNLILETAIQEISEDEFRKNRQREFTSLDANDQSEGNYPMEDGAVILPIQLILAPVSGTPIYELKVGDKIMSKVIPDSDRANYFIDLLNLRIENFIKPIACEVIDIKSEGANTPLEVLTKIGPGIFGKCTEEERQVKLRMYNPSVNGLISEKSIDDVELNPKGMITKDSKHTTHPKVSYIAIGILVIILLIIIILLVSL